MKEFLSNHKRLVIISAVILVVLIIVIIISSRRTTSSIRTLTTTAAKGTIIQTVAATGNVAAIQEDNAGFNAAGKIKEIDVKVGDTVTAGQVLAKIDDTSLQNSLAQAQSSLNSAYNNRNNTLVKGKYTTYDIYNLNESIKQAQLKVQTAQQNLGDANLASQIKGTVVQINNIVGDSVNGSGSTSTNSTSAQSSAVVVVLDTSAMTISLNVTETDVNKMQTGEVAQVTFDAVQGKDYTGKVVTVDPLPTISSGVVSYTVKVQMDKIDSSVKPGMSATATIITASKDNVLVIPSSYIISNSDGTKSVRVQSGGSTQLVTVTTGLSDDTNTEITSGLNEGDTVVTTISSSTSNSTSGASLFNVGGGGGAVRGTGGATFRGGN